VSILLEQAGEFEFYCILDFLSIAFVDNIFEVTTLTNCATAFATEKRLTDYENLTDFELAQYSNNGDETAFAEIVRRYSPRVFRFASRFFNQRSLVEEMAQDVFLKAFTQLDKFEGRGSLEGWLTRITVNTCINHLRSAKRETQATVVSLTETETDWLEQKMSNAATARHLADEEKMIAADLINRLLETMSPDDRTALTLLDGEGYSIREITEITGWTESKVKIQAFRARRRMREAMEKLLEIKR
jgi:RNA polymerase sigma-70 factor, ECF subfamily